MPAEQPVWSNPWLEVQCLRVKFTINRGSPDDGVVYRIPCECGKVYIGETGRPMQDRIKEHDRDVRLARTETSAVSEHAHNTGHKPLWNKVKFIDRDPYYYTRRVKEAIHVRASCFIRSRMTSRPHHLKKTSSMQSKRRDLHHTWLHRETNEKLSFYCYSPRWITTTFCAWLFSSELSHTLRISLAIKNDKSVYVAQVKHILNSPRDVRNYTRLTFDGNWPGKTRWLFYYLVAHKSPAYDCDMFDTQETLQGGRLQYTGNCFCERIVHPVCICT